MPRWVALRPPSWVIVSFGSKGEREAVDRLEGRAEGDRGALVADAFGADREGGAVGGVDHEVFAVDVDADFAHADRDAADDFGHDFGVGDDVGVGGIDVEGDADDDGAVVIGAGEGGGDRGEAEAGRPGRGRRGRSCRARGRGVRRGRRRRWWCRFQRTRGSSGAACSAAAEGLGGGEDVGFGAVGEAVEVGGEARGHGEVEVAEELVAVFAVELEGEGGEAAGFGVAGAGVEGRVEGADLAGAFGAVGAFGEAEDLAGVLGGERLRSRGRSWPWSV